MEFREKKTNGNRIPGVPVSEPNINKESIHGLFIFRIIYTAFNGGDNFAYHYELNRISFSSIRMGDHYGRLSDLRLVGRT